METEYEKVKLYDFHMRSFFPVFRKAFAKWFKSLQFSAKSTFAIEDQTKAKTTFIYGYKDNAFHPSNWFGVRFFSSKLAALYKASKDKSV